MYANPNRPDLVGKYISDDLKDAKGKMFRKEFLLGVRNHGECYVDYWYRKFDNHEPSPKTTFFKLTNDGQYIVAAGMYLDDIEQDISAMMASVNAELKRHISIFSAAVISTILFFLYLSNCLSNRVRDNFELFADFFKHAVHSDKKIDRSLIRFTELDQMAGYANQMLYDKIIIQGDLSNEREQLLVTLYSIVDGVITTDLSGKVVLINPVAEKLTGWNHEAAEGQNLAMVFNVYDTSISLDKINELNLFSGTEKQVLLIAKDDTEYRIACSRAPMKDSMGNDRGYVFIFRDETEKLAIQEELLKAKKLESIGFLAGGIAHDFNNILAGLFGNIELAKRRMSQEHPAFSYIDIACQSLNRATSLTKQLLTFSKGGDPFIEAINIQEVIKSIVVFNLSGSRIEVKIDLPNDLWAVKADRGQFGQVIENLVINAKHAMPKGGTLSVTAENILNNATPSTEEDRGDCVKLSIHDEGSGIPPELIDKIFDPYFSTKKDGNGLGLATVRSIIKKHHGSINVKSNFTAGTTFTIYLPADRILSTTTPEMTNPHTSEISSGGNILIMDDEKSLQTLLVETLDLQGHKVDIACNGEEVLAKYRQALENNEPFDVLILDLTIPGGMGGKETAEQILTINPHAKIIASSGYSNDPVMANYKDYGFVGRIEKPFSIEILLDEVSKAIILTEKGMSEKTDYSLT